MRADGDMELTENESVRREMGQMSYLATTYPHIYSYQRWAVTNLFRGCTPGVVCSAELRVGAVDMLNSGRVHAMQGPARGTK